MAHIYGSKTEYYVGEISRHLDLTYAHLLNLLKFLEREQYVEFKNLGRQKFVRLTEKGMRMGQVCYNLTQKVGEDIKNEQQSD